MKGRILAVAAVATVIALAIPWFPPTAPPPGPVVAPAGPRPGTDPAAHPDGPFPNIPAHASAPSLAGTVVDDATGMPVPDAPVRVHLLAGGGGEVGPREVRTDRDGAFRVDLLPRGSFRVRAGWETGEHRGTHDAADAVPVAAGTHDLRILLRGGRPLAGRVLAQDGTPFLDPFRVRAGIPVAESSRSRHRREVLCDAPGAGGAFLVPDARAGEHDLEILPVPVEGRPAVHAPLLLRGIPAGTETVVARLPRGLSVEGSVEDEGGFPVPDGEILAFPIGERRAAARMGGGVRRDGTFSTGLLDPRVAYDLVFTRIDASRGIRQWGLARRVAPGTKGHRVVVGDSSPLRGRVEDGAGRSAGRGIPVRATFADYDIEHDAATETEADGSFTLGGLGTPGSFRFRVWAGGGGGFAPSPAPVRLAPGDPPAVLRVARGESISGTLRWRSGEPLRGGIVLAGPDTDEWPLPWIASGTCDHEGRFRLRDLPEGVIRIRGRFAGHDFPLGTAAAPGDGYELRHPGW